MLVAQLLPTRDVPLLEFSPIFIDDDRATIFPFDGDAKVIRLPIVAARAHLSGDGRYLYATKLFFDPSFPGLLKVDLARSDISQVIGTEEFRSIYAVTTTPTGDRAFISGNRQLADGRESCGVFEIDASTPSARPLLPPDPAQCEYAGAWKELSTSPSGDRIVGKRSGQIGLIDAHRMTVTVTGQGSSPVLSPDGKWLAALSNDQQLWVSDATDLTRGRPIARIDGYRLSWAPDSKHLLYSDNHLLCGGYHATLKVISVEDGKITTVASSRCRVNRPSFGWVSNSVWKK